MSEEYVKEVKDEEDVKYKIYANKETRNMQDGQSEYYEVVGQTKDEVEEMLRYAIEEMNKK